MVKAKEVTRPIGVEPQKLRSIMMSDYVLTLLDEIVGTRLTFGPKDEADRSAVIRGLISAEHKRLAAAGRAPKR
jgi:hypothetical protein